MLVDAAGAITALGTPGGDQQDTWQPLLVLRLVHGMDLQAAIDAPAFHTEGYAELVLPRSWDDLRAVVEDRLGDDVIAGPPGARARGRARRRLGARQAGERLARPGHRHPQRRGEPARMHGYAAGR